MRSVGYVARVEDNFGGDTWGKKKKKGDFEDPGPDGIIILK
jgi:hypothetical protein